MRRSALFWVGLAASAAATVGLWMVGIKAAFLVLLFPLLFWPRRGARSQTRCAACGFASVDPQTRFCPRDGIPLD